MSLRGDCLSPLDTPQNKGTGFSITFLIGCSAIILPIFLCSQGPLKRLLKEVVFVGLISEGPVTFYPQGNNCQLTSNKTRKSLTRDSFLKIKMWSKVPCLHSQRKMTRSLVHFCSVRFSSADTNFCWKKVCVKYKERLFSANNMVPIMS